MTSNKKEEKVIREFKFKTNAQKEMEEWVLKSTEPADDDLIPQSNKSTTFAIGKDATILNNFLRRQVW